ncbi:MAG: protease modulator HflK [Gemmataceae bacterium]
MRLLKWALAILLALYLLTGVVQVRRGERAVVRRFGRVLAERPEPGLWVGLPYGMDRVDRVEVDTVRSVEVGYRPEAEAREAAMPEGQLLTGDHNLVNVQVVLYYRVRPEQVVEFVLAGDRVAPSLERAAEAAMATWVAGRDVDDVLLRGKNALRAELIPRLRDVVEPYNLGVEVLDVRVAKVAPPDEVKDAFDNVARAQTQITTLRHRAEQEAATRLRLAGADRFRIEEAAKGYAHSKRVIARQDARRFTERLRQYRAARDGNPDYLRQLWQEERGRLFATLRQNGMIDLLDHRLSEGGLDVITAPKAPGR